MSSTLRKCVALGPKGVRAPMSEQDYRGPGVAGYFSETNTRWVRLWAEWPVIQPDGAHAPDDPANPGYNNLLALDGQIKAARANGLSVVVTAWRFTTWANRIYSKQAGVWPRTSADQGSKGDADMVPDDLSTTSDWANWIRFLYGRYKPLGTLGTDIQILEICNEPNFQMWPQRDSGNSLWITGRTRDMLRTAQAVSADFDHYLFIMGPGVTDVHDGSDRLQTDYVDFMNDLLSSPYPGFSKFIWSHHNYKDIEAQSQTSSPYKGSPENAVVGLHARWAGYSEGGGPVLFNTEGGARLANVGTLQTQASDDTSGFNESLNAAQVGMQTNYLFDDDDQQQVNGGYSGLRNAYPDASPRPAYTAWGQLQAGETDLVRFRGGEDLGWTFKWDPCICSQHAGHVEAFVVGMDNAVWHDWNYGGGWSGWNSLGAPSGGTQSAPAAISIKDGSMHLFALGSNRNVYGQWWTTAGWSGWYNLGGTCTADPAVGSWNGDHLELFVRGTDNAIWHKWWWSSSGWSDWFSLGGSAGSAPAAVSWDYGRMDVVYTGAYNHVYHNWYDGSWHVWEDLGGTATSSPDICSWAPGRLDIFVRGTDNRLWRKFFDGAWSTWEPVPGTGTDAGPGAVSWGGTRIDTVWLTGGHVWHGWHY